MSIALDATYRVDPQPSGIAVYSAELLDGLAECYPECDFIQYYRPKQFRLASRSRFGNVKQRLLLPFGRARGAQIFHALNQRVDRRLAPRVVATFHDLFVMTADYSTAEFRARFTEQARRAADQADLIITVSEFTARQVEALLRVERERVRVIPHGVHLPATIDTEREQMILFVGALQARKNVTRLVEAFEHLPQNWKLVLAGAPTGYRAEETLERIQVSNARERIEVTGYLPQAQLERLFARASIFAFPSLDEGFGIPVLEAMAWGVPVVTAHGSALEELASGAALLVDPVSVEQITAALRKLIENADLRSELIHAGRLRAAAHTWENAVKKTSAVYQELGATCSHLRQRF